MDFSSRIGLPQGDKCTPDGIGTGSPRPVIAVTMATSRQGTAVVRHLSKSGIFEIRAIARSPFSKQAMNLAKLPNVNVVKGDLLEAETLESAFSGVYGIFGNTTPTKGWVLGRGSMVRDYEIAQGKNLIDAVKNHAHSGALKHFIFSSVCKPKDPLKSDPAPGHFTSKWSIEEYILINGLKQISTIIRPVSYFENFDTNLPGVQISKTVFPGVVDKDKVWQTIAVDDVGQWVKAVFKNPKMFLGESINIAGEELTGMEMAALWQKIKSTGTQSVQYSMVPRKIMNLIEHDIGLMANWIERAGYGADLKKLRILANELDITITSLSSWLREKDSLNNSTKMSNVSDLRSRFIPVT